MLDLILGWAVIFFPTALAVVFIFIPARSENESAHMKWRYCLVMFGVIFSLLAWLQQSRALKASTDDRESAIQETSARVATETADRVTKAMAAQYEGTISGLNKQIGSLERELSAQGKSVAAIKGSTQQELGLNYVPSVDLLWQNKEFDIISHGKTNLYFWGDKLDDGPKSIDKPRLITPTGSYHLYGEHIEKEILAKIGNNQESRVPFELYVSGEDRRKHILKYQLWIRVKDGMVKIDTQNLGTVDADF